MADHATNIFQILANRILKLKLSDRFICLEISFRCLFRRRFIFFTVTRGTSRESPLYGLEIASQKGNVILELSQRREKIHVSDDVNFKQRTYFANINCF